MFIFQGCSKPKASVFKDTRLAQEEEVKFCLLGDLGRNTAHQKAMAEALDREDCHRIFFLGDLVYPSGIDSVNDPGLQSKFLDYYLPLLEKNPDLYINLVLGNHDHKGDPAAWRDVAKRHEGFFFPYYYYMIDYGGLCMVAMDTSFYYYTKMVAEAGEQSTWLLKLQPRLKECEVKVALTHHPLKGDSYAGSMDWNGATGGLKAFLEGSVIGKFDLHITGHVHVLVDDGKDEGTRMLISGTGGEILGGGRPGFVILRWEPHNPKRVGYSFRYIDVDVNVFADEPADPVKQEQSDEEPEDIINKQGVEEPWFYKTMDKIKYRF